MPSPTSPDLVPSWRPGRFVSPRGRTKLVVLGGLGSRTGDAERAFGGLAGFLAARAGYDPRRDILEASYAGRQVAGRWQPRPFTAADTRQPLMDSAEAVAGSLEWYRDVLPPSARLCLVGFSLGGVVALDGATLAVARDRAGWQDRLLGVVTLASPLHGCNAGPLIQWAWLGTTDADPLGVVGEELDRRWSDPQERERVERRAAFLRASGATVLTLSNPDDAVVRPDEALLPGPGERPQDLLVQTDRVLPGSLGHGSLRDEPAVWRRILALMGPQPAGPAAGPAGADDPIERELAALKERLREQGRLR